MATPVNELPAVDPDSGRVNVVVDTPRGSRNKYKLDEQSGQWRLSKVLPQGVAFPYDFGFIPSTRGEDGDPVDVLLLADEPAFPGCVVSARLIGVLEAEQTEGGKTVRNDRLIAAVETRYNPAEYRSLDDVSRPRLDEIEHFFVSYNKMEGRQFRPLARRGGDRGQQLLEEEPGPPARERTAQGDREAGSRGDRSRGGRRRINRSHAMSFKLKPGQSLRKNLRRVARQQTDVALEQL